MRVFQVRHGATGAILWTGAAAGEPQALDAMAHAAGYRDHSEMPDTIRRSGLSVEFLTFGTSDALFAGHRVQGRRTGRIMDHRSSAAGRGDSGEARNG